MRDIWYFSSAEAESFEEEQTEFGSFVCIITSLSILPLTEESGTNVDSLPSTVSLFFGLGIFREKACDGCLSYMKSRLASEQKSAHAYRHAQVKG